MSLNCTILGFYNNLIIIALNLNSWIENHTCIVRMKNTEIQKYNDIIGILKNYKQLHPPPGYEKSSPWHNFKRSTTELWQHTKIKV